MRLPSSQSKRVVNARLRAVRAMDKAATRMLLTHCEWLQGRSMLIMKMEKDCHWSMHLDASMTELTCSWKPVPSTVLPFLP